jgi:hypothetical protein
MIVAAMIGACLATRCAQACVLRAHPLFLQSPPSLYVFVLIYF